PQLNLAAGRASAGLVDDEYPIASGIVEEGAVRDQHRPGRIAQGQLGLDRLAALHVRRLLAEEHEVHLELAVADLRINLGDAHLVGLAVNLGSGRLSDLDPAEIEFVDVSLELVAPAAAVV